MAKLQKIEQPDLELKDLGQFIGTQQYYSVFGVRVTDGVKYVMDNGYAWLVTDSIAVIRCKPKVRREPFLVVELKVNLEEHTAKMVISDGNDNELHSQEYTFTDAKRDVTLWCENGVMILPSEH